jgi:hypothetical protein
VTERDDSLHQMTGTLQALRRERDLPLLSAVVALDGDVSKLGDLGKSVSNRSGVRLGRQ